ncbi:hypothetical protein ACPCI1_04210 [Streptomyces seoulensis]
MPAPHRPEPTPQVPMRALLASCAAAKTISTPPPPPVEHAPVQRKAA